VTLDGPAVTGELDESDPAVDPTETDLTPEVSYSEAEQERPVEEEEEGEGQVMEVNSDLQLGEDSVTSLSTLEVKHILHCKSGPS
jgi:hypothetical protein